MGADGEGLQDRCIDTFDPAASTGEGSFDLLCGACGPQSFGVCSPFCKNSHGPSQFANLSDGALRLIRRIQRDPPVDLNLERPSVRTAVDIRAVITEVARAGGTSVKKLTIGPWESSGHACGSCSSPAGLESGDDGDAALD